MLLCFLFFFFTTVNTPVLHLFRMDEKDDNNNYELFVSQTTVFFMKVLPG